MPSDPATWMHGDTWLQAVGLLLLGMSLASWFILLRKTALLLRAQRRVPRAIAAFWSAASPAEGARAARAADPDELAGALAEAFERLGAPGGPAWQTRADRVRRELREALDAAGRRLHSGHVVLASVGSTAPFIGLFGTVWGIYHALQAIAATHQMGVDSIAGPVGETLLMTAAGLAVAIPAVLGYNALGKRARALDAQLEGFALDLQHLLAADTAHAPRSP
ncbi:MAG: MotA/TolQ/ExbB proton channel family protein [Betaproteobacteria bacterium]|nr:MotA/TolQ/ExbB proton channel family protein [Betaproteobacteria bacterium]